MANKKKTKKKGKSSNNRRVTPKGFTPGGRQPDMGISTFDTYIGQATRTGYRLYVNDMYMDFETPIATLKSEIIVPALMILINDKLIDKWNADQQDNYADLVCYCAQLLCELKSQVKLIEYAPAITRADATGLGTPFTRATFESLIMSLAGLEIPIMSYALANILDPVIQIAGCQFLAGTPATYVLTQVSHKTYAQLETLIGVITGLYDAVVYSTQGNLQSVPFDMQWLNTIQEVSYHSDYGSLLSRFLPARVNDGGVTESFIEVDETYDLVYNGLYGVCEIQDAIALLRTSSAADNPKPFSFTVNPAADKYSWKYLATVGATTLTALGKATEDMDMFEQVAGAMSRTPIGEFVPNIMDNGYVTNVLSSPDAWNRRAAIWLAKHCTSSSFTINSAPTLPDFVGTSGRRSANAVITPGASYSSIPPQVTMSYERYKMRQTTPYSPDPRDPNWSVPQNEGWR